MGNINCSKCRNKEDVFNEIKSDSSSYDNVHIPNDKHFSSDLSNINISKPKEFRNPYTEYSLALFQLLNLIRTEPLKFYSESDKYNLSNIIEELIDKNYKSLKQLGQQKRKIINNIMRDNKVIDIRKKLNLIK